MKLHPSLAAFLIAPVVAFVHARSWAERLPARVATHFGADGVPNAWSDRDGAIHLYLLTVVGISLVLLLVTALLGVLPPSTINMPNRDHWLAPERREETTRKMTNRMAIFGVGMGLFLIAMFDLTFRASMQTAVALPNSTFLVYLGAFLAFVLLWVISLYRAFRMPDPETRA